MSIKSWIQEWLGVKALNKGLNEVNMHVNTQSTRALIEMRKQIILAINDLAMVAQHPEHRGTWEWMHTQGEFTLAINRLTSDTVKRTASEEAMRVSEAALSAIKSEDFIDTVVDRINRKRLI